MLKDEIILKKINPITNREVVLNIVNYMFWIDDYFELVNYDDPRLKIQKHLAFKNEKYKDKIFLLIKKFEESNKKIGYNRNVTYVDFRQALNDIFNCVSTDFVDQRDCFFYPLRSYIHYFKEFADTIYNKDFNISIGNNIWKIYTFFEKFFTDIKFYITQKDIVNFYIYANDVVFYSVNDFFYDGIDSFSIKDKRCFNSEFCNPRTSPTIKNNYYNFSIKNKSIDQFIFIKHLIEKCKKDKSFSKTLIQNMPKYEERFRNDNKVII